MPRDDLSIDWNGFVNMPPIDHPDAASVLEDFINRIQNLPAEIRFLQDEIADKERQIQICMDIINSRDASIQKWTRLNSSLVKNPKEEHLTKQVLENYDRAQLLQEEKCALAVRSQQVLDRHLLYLDGQIKALQDRGEFPIDDDIPSLLRPQVPDRANSRSDTSGPSMPLGPTQNSSNIATSTSRYSQQTPQRIASLQIHQQANNTMASSAPATPAAALLLNRQARESSLGASNKRQRIVTAGNNIPTNSSGLARHSSIGPGTPKAGTPAAARAGSAGPRSIQKGIASSKKLAPHKVNSMPRKGKPGKSGLSRVKRSGTKNSPSSTNDSELSDAESGSGDDDEEALTPPAVGRDDIDDDMIDIDDDDGNDDKKYCTCQSISYGDMVACDNDACPYEWFHWSCVGLKSEPVGTWICPVCTEEMKKKKLNRPV